ncbi:hypothetical protein AURDEDRAFT_182893 [Auricularia subglabra TFB-10046 SS5]|nr:hypothetical protein AURDEDRAFT_182893 [Auricularia subglabra TFB-10046 SS5]
MANRLEPMNASQHHSKVKVAIELGARTYVAGQEVAGKISVETRADAALGISVIQVELIAVQELSSRDHHATSTFLHSRRMFQGPGLPPSNAVEALPRPGDPVQMPQGYWPARRGTTTFFFRFPVPLSAPSSINFGNGLAKVTYRLKATVGVFWKGEKRFVTDLKDAELVECALPPAAPEGTVVVGDGGKIWMQGLIVGGVGIAGHPSCVELSVKNHTSKKASVIPTRPVHLNRGSRASGLTLSLIRKLHLPATALPGGKGATFQLSDTLLTVPFRGPEYTVLPGGEGVANLVFDIPRWARGVRGGLRQSVEGEVLPADGAISELSSGKLTDALFEDLVLDLPINIMHPAAVPEPPPPPEPFPGQFPPLEAPRPPFMGGDLHSGQSSPTLYNPGYPSPGGHVYAALPPTSPVYAPQPIMSPQPQWAPSGQPYYYPPPLEVWAAPARPLSAGGSYPMPPMPPAPIQHMANVAPASHSHAQSAVPPPPSGLPTSGSGRPLPVPMSPPRQAPSGLPASSSQRPVPAWVMGAAPESASAVQPSPAAAVGSEEGKGERASRIAQKLHESRRDRSASPTSRRFVHSRASQPLAIALPAQQVQIEPPLLSPRPMLSPKASYANIPGSAQGTQGTVKLSDVRQLERMAEDEAKQEELAKVGTGPGAASGAGSAAGEGTGAGAGDSIGLTGMVVAGPGGFPVLDSPPKAVDKTLPGPPVPSGKAPPSAANVPRATDIFGVGLGAPSPHVSDDLARAAGATLTIPKRSSGFVKPAGGLEALEKRLLADVGTTKVQARVAEAETESIVRKLGVHAEEEGEYSVEELLKLSGGLDGALDRRRLSRDVPPLPEKPQEKPSERMQREAAELTAVRPHGSDAPIMPSGLPPMTASQQRKMREQEDPARKHEERKREEEAAKLRRAAKGRIANWLGGVSPEPVPEPVLEEQEPTVRAHRRTSAEVDRTRRISQPPPPEVKELRNVGKSNSDATLKPSDDAHRTRRTSLPPPPTTPERSAPEERLTPAKSSDDVNRTRRISLPPPAKQEPVVEVFKNVSPAAAAPKPRPSSMVHSRSQPIIPRAPSPKGEVRNPLKALESPPAVSPVAAKADNNALGLPQPKLYDVRSARGGRGGKVTAVAAIWAAAVSKEPTSPPLKSPTSPLMKPKKFDFPPPRADVPTPGPVPKPNIAVSKPKAPTPALALPRSTTSPALSSGPTSPRLALSPTPRAMPPPVLPKPTLPAVAPKPAPPAIVPKPVPPPIAPKPASLSSDRLPTSPQFRKPLSTAASSRPAKLSPTPAAPARMIKSTSVPAAISASVAKPTLSSTASLARPMTSIAAARMPTSPRVAPATTISELPEVKKPSAAAALRNLQQQDKDGVSAAPAAAKPELQFGKARLKELIQKYQDGR